MEIKAIWRSGSRRPRRTGRMIWAKKKAVPSCNLHWCHWCCLCDSNRIANNRTFCIAGSYKDFDDMEDLK